MGKMNDEIIVKVVRDMLELRKTILSSFVPDEAHRHFRSARREALLGIKAILEHAVNQQDEQCATPPTSRSIEIKE
jgi:hypothetical protein